jgi:altronate dehydratase
MKTIQNLKPGQTVEAFIGAEAALIKSPALKYAVDYAIDSAAQNAHDTCGEDYLDRAHIDAYLARYHEVFQATLESITTYRETSEATRKWFARRGIVG